MQRALIWIINAFNAAAVINELHRAVGVIAHLRGEELKETPSERCESFFSCIPMYYGNGLRNIHRIVASRTKLA